MFFVTKHNDQLFPRSHFFPSTCAPICYPSPFSMLTLFYLPQYPQKYPVFLKPFIKICYFICCAYIYIWIYAIIHLLIYIYGNKCQVSATLPSPSFYLVTICIFMGAVRRVVNSWWTHSCSTNTQFESPASISAFGTCLTLAVPLQITGSIINIFFLACIWKFPSTNCLFITFKIFTNELCSHPPPTTIDNTFSLYDFIKLPFKWILGIKITS